MNIQDSYSSEQSAQVFPSLSFQVGKDCCSITARCVSAILCIPDQVIHFPEAPSYCKGLIHLRGQVIPLVDMRVLFGLPTLEQEYAGFCAMLDQRKQDHINWVTELERCMGEDQPFTLATDHHQCALGKWYDALSSETNAVTFHLHKLDEPHQRFHAVSRLYNQCNKDHEHCRRDVCLKRDVEAARNEYMPTILKLLEEAKDVFLSSYQAIVIVIEGEQGQIGLVTDQVHSVETIVPVDQGHGGGCFSQGRFISGVAKSEKTGELLLALSDQALLDLCESLRY